MRLEIRDIESAMVYDIGPDGAVLGRERARTDISLRDESISKRHARIFMQDGDWLLEDLSSSNGTYVDDQRITAPIRLVQGRVFSLAQRKFEVVYIEGVAAPAAPPAPAPAAHDFGAPPAAAFEETGAQMASMGAAPNPGFAEQVSFDDEPEPRGIGYFFVAVPKAVGFYAVQVPLMALNPFGRINRSFHEQPLPAMTSLEVAAYAIPAAFISGLLGGLFQVIATAIGGTVAFDGLIAVLPMAGIAAAIAGVVGFITHPVSKFLIQLFRGESTPKSRTNFVIHGYVLSIVTVVPAVIGVVLAAVPVPFVHLLGPLLALVAAAVNVYFLYQWLKVFDVFRAVQYVVLAFGAVGVVLTALGFVNGVIDTIDGVEGQGAMAVDTSSLTPEEQRAFENNPEGAAALAAAKAAQGQKTDDKRIQAVLAESAKKQREAQEMAEPQTAPGAPPATPAPATVAPTNGKPNGGGTPAVMASSISEDKYPLGTTPFVVFLRKRDAIERAIDADPALVNDSKIRKDYERLWRVTYQIRDKYYKKKGPRWKKDKILQREKGQEIFKRTNKYVDRIYSVLIDGH